MSGMTGMVVGALRIRLVIRGARSLKEKRSVVKGLKDRVRHRFNVSIAEVDDLENCQSAVLGVALVGNDGEYVRSVLSQVTRLARLSRDAELVASDMEML